MGIFENMCFYSTDESDIIRWLNEINTLSEEINRSIELVKDDLLEPNCQKRDKSEKRLKQLRETAELFEKYNVILSQKKDNESSESYKNLKVLFNAVSLNVDMLDLLNHEIKKFMSNVKNEIGLIITKKEVKPISINELFASIKPKYSKKTEYSIETKYSKTEESNIKEQNIEKIEISIEELFKKYYWDKPVTNRWEINSIFFTKNLYFAVDRWEISLEQKQEIIEYWYQEAFKKEIQFWDGKKGIKNIKKYEKRWKEIFYQELKTVIVSRKKAESLFLLSWVEWNWLDQKMNDFWAIWPFQIQLSTWKGQIRWTTKKNLHNYIHSAKVSAKFIKKLIIKIKKQNPNYNDDELISNAITKYNWAFSNRLLENKKTDVNNTIYDLYKDLNWIKVLINNKNVKTDTILKIREKLLNTHNKYYKHEGDWNWSFPWTSHFWILEKNITSWKQVIKWIDYYLKTILKQQDMYALQFNAINNVYNKHVINKKI